MKPVTAPDQASPSRTHVSSPPAPVTAPITARAIPRDLTTLTDRQTPGNEWAGFAGCHRFDTDANGPKFASNWDGTE